MIDIKEIKNLIGIKTIAAHADITERQAYNLVNSWKKEISKRDQFLLQSVISERIGKLERLYSSVK